MLCMSPLFAPLVIDFPVAACSLVVLVGRARPRRTFGLGSHHCRAHPRCTRVSGPRSRAALLTLDATALVAALLICALVRGLWPYSSPQSPDSSFAFPRTSLVAVAACRPPCLTRSSLLALVGLAVGVSLAPRCHCCLDCLRGWLPRLSLVISAWPTPPSVDVVVRHRFAHRVGLRALLIAVAVVAALALTGVISLVTVAALGLVVAPSPALLVVRGCRFAS